MIEEALWLQAHPLPPVQTDPRTQESGLATGICLPFTLMKGMPIRVSRQHTPTVPSVEDQMAAGLSHDAPAGHGSVLEEGKV